MKKSLLFFCLMFVSVAMLTTSCEKDETIIDSSLPSGTFTATKSGTFTASNGTPTAGSAALGTDSDNVNFLEFGSDFVTQLATGTVSVYLSTSSEFVADPANGNPDLKQVGAVNSNGLQYFKFASAPESKYTHVILWCNTAGIPFGHAALN